MTSYTNKCQYEVQTRQGMESMTGWEAERRFGVRVWDHFGEYVDHSPWCPLHSHSQKLTDPFAPDVLDIDPPF